MILLINQRYSESKKIRHVNYAYTEKTQKISKDQKSCLIKKVKKKQQIDGGKFSATRKFQDPIGKTLFTYREKNFYELCTKLRHYLQQKQTCLRNPKSVAVQVASFLHYISDEERYRKTTNAFKLQPQSFGYNQKNFQAGKISSYVRRMLLHAGRSKKFFLKTQKICLKTPKELVSLGLSCTGFSFYEYFNRQFTQAVFFMFKSHRRV